METQTYQRKPIYVEAVRVTEENFFDVAQWCQGGIVSGNNGTQSLDALKKDKSKFIKVRVINPQRLRQTKAFVGDWVLYSEYQGYKVYTNGAFENAFLGPIEEPKSIEQAIEQARETEAKKAEANGREPENVPDGTYGGARQVS